MVIKTDDIPWSAPRPLNAQDRERASQISQEISEKLAGIADDSLLAGQLLVRLQQDRELDEFLAAAFSLSGHLRDCALIRPRILAECLRDAPDVVIEELLVETAACWKDAESEGVLMERLRIAKRKLSLTLGLADLGGWLECADVTRFLSRFADVSLMASCSFLMKDMERAGKIQLPNTDNPLEGSGLIVLGMGKYGAYELNYSSDIDIILFFDLSRPVQLLDDDPTSVFVRFAKRLSRILQERTGDGYVFRVDLRLRPDPGSTPLAIPVETAFNYYEAYGQNWERAAFIKARAVAGDIAAGKLFLKELSPFVWRKFLDFAAIQDVHSIKRQIHAHKGHGEIAVRGHNVKLGRGGIREIEFFVQTQQLIAGGRRENLRKTGTIEGLNALAEDGWISRTAAEEMASAYWFLRAVEHRIQMVADEQSHTLPEDDAGLERIAFMTGCASFEEFSRQITNVMRTVETHYAALFEASPQLTGKGGNLVFTGDDEDPATVNTIAEMGFRQPSQIISTVKGWHYGRYNAVRSGQARELLTELTPTLLESFAETPNPDQAFFAFDRFLGGLPAGLQFFSILKSNPALVRLITLILGSAPRLAEIITRRPHVFDGLIDPSFSASVPDRHELLERLQIALSRLSSYEAKLDQARIFAAEQKFLIGVRLINRTINARQSGLAYTALAETLLQCLLPMVRKEFEARHGRIAGGEIAILGMGRLGSRDLTAGSDLDLIFLYRHDDDAEASDGEKSLYPQQYFTRFVQRLIAAMSAPTAEGVIYELDFRLRPSGNSGPLATQLSSFSKYQREEAWTWERQSLIRARTIAGDNSLLLAIEEELHKLRSRPDNNAAIASDILDMRKTLDSEKPPENLYDVKRAKGGLIDIEFLTQFAALKYGIREKPDHDPSTQALIDSLTEEMIDAGEREMLTSAFELYNGILQIVRVCLQGEYDPENADKGFEQLLLEQVSLPDMRQLQTLLKDSQAAVRKIFLKALKQ